MNLAQKWFSEDTIVRRVGEAREAAVRERGAWMWMERRAVARWLTWDRCG